MSKPRFTASDDRLGPTGGSAHQREPLHRVDRRVRAHRLVQARHDVHLDVEDLDRLGELEHRGLRLAREREDHALDVEQAHEERQVLRRPEHADAGEVRRSRARGSASAKPTRLTPYSLVVEELARHELADVARADDERVLQVVDAPAAEAARRRPAHRDERDRERPERDEALGLRAHDLERRGRHEQAPGADRHEVEHADDVVRRRVVRPLVVVVVEPVDLGRHGPDRQRGQEEQQLRPAPATEPAASAGPPKQQERDEIRERQADDVGQEQHAGDEPSPASPRRHVAAGGSRACGCRRPAAAGASPWPVRRRGGLRRVSVMHLPGRSSALPFLPRKAREGTRSCESS